MDNEWIARIEARRAFKPWFGMANNFDVKHEMTSIVVLMQKRLKVFKHKWLVSENIGS